jgi:hypothetical protein
VETLAGTTWASSKGPLPAGWLVGQTVAVATDGGVGVAVGSTVSGGVQRALIAVDLPLTG